jgi:hypothetical protein
MLAGAPARAFGPLGHRVVGEVAEPLLCENTRRQVAELLEPGESLAEAGLWADRIRNDRLWSRSGPWHYLNVPGGGSPERVSRVSSDNLLAALARFERELLDRELSRDARATALRFVIHLVADLHQPLHVGRADDRGGNRIEILVEGERNNLHAFWDAQYLLGRDSLSARDLARSLEGLRVLGAADAPAGAGRGRNGPAHPWQAGEPVDWARESLALRPSVYDFRQARSGPTKLSRTYQAGARNTLNLRLVQAGVRLAGRLNRLGCDAAPRGR